MIYRFACLSITLVILQSLLFPKSTVLATGKQEPVLNSDAAILIDAATSEVLFNKNSRKRKYPASITKILTAIIAIETGNLNDRVTVSKNATEVDGTRVYLLPGEKILLEQLLEGLLINSGNDAAIAIAEHLAGSVDRFAERMNDYTEKLGLKDSRFVNPSGLFAENHYTTAYDMAMITKYAMQNGTFREIVGTNKLKWKSEGWETVIYNYNRMLRQYNGATGVKNGWVPQSGYTLVTSAKRDGTELIAVTLDATSDEQAYIDSTKLLNYGFDLIESKNEKISQILNNKDQISPLKKGFLTDQTDKKTAINYLNVGDYLSYVFKNIFTRLSIYEG